MKRKHPLDKAKIRGVIADCFTASREQNIKAARFVDGINTTTTMRHGYLMSSIAYRNAWEWLKNAIGEPPTREDIDAILDTKEP